MKSLKALKTQLIFAVIAVSLSLFVTEALIRHFWRLPEMEKISQINDALDLRRLASEIQQELTALEIIAYDNAVWDETYDALLEKNTAWLTSTFLISRSYERLGISGWYFYTKQGDYLIGSLLDKKEDNTFFKDTNQLLNLGIIFNGTSQTELVTKAAQTTFTSVNGHPAVLISHTILRSDESKSPIGTLLIYQKINDTLIDRITPTVNNDILLHTMDGSHASVTAPLHNVLQSSITDLKINAFKKRLFLGLANNEDPPLVAASIKQRPRLYSNAIIDVSLIWVMLVSLVALALFYRFVNKQMLIPIRKILRTIAEAQNKADFTLLTNMKGGNEIHQLGQRLDKLFILINAQQHILEKNNASLTKMSHTDPLTGLYNRRYFDSFVEALLNSPVTYEEPLALLMIDIDYFKRYNDNYGHAKGDEVLQQVAHCLKQHIHSATDMVCRFGGEEFVIILKNTTGEAANRVAFNLIKGIQECKLAHHASSISPFVSISVGVAWKGKNQDLDTKGLFENADKALYEAKGRGRNRYVNLSMEEG